MPEATVQAVLADLATAPIAEPLRATLALLRKVTRGEGVAVEDIRALLALGVTKQQIRDALNVCFCFNVITRLADTFCFEISSPASYDASAKFLLSRGYK